MQTIRKALASEADILTKIAIDSEAYWGYDSEYMAAFKREYSVTKDFIANNPTYVLEKEEVIGFYGIIINENKADLEYLFIQPNYIGSGYGKLLWQHMIKTCRALGIVELTMVTSPQAKDFYLKMGCTEAGKVSSLIGNGRIIPKLSYLL